MTAVRYIHISEDGAVDDRLAPDWWAALDDVGPEGFNRVQLTRDLAAFVNDCGLILPERYRRNPVAGALLHMLGAAPIPYAGPIVLAAPQTRSEGTPIEAEPESGVVPGSAAESGIPVPDSAPNLPREESGPVAIPPSPDLDQWRDDFQMLIWDARNLMRSPAEVVAEKAGPELLGELARVADDLWSYSEAVAKAAG